MRPEWVIYKNEQRVSVAISWHKGLDVALKLAGVSCYSVELWVSQVKVKFNFKNDKYEIIKER